MLVARGFSQRPRFDYLETYSHVMDEITFYFLMCMTCIERLKTRLMDVTAAYLYDSLDSKEERVLLRLSFRINRNHKPYIFDF